MKEGKILLFIIGIYSLIMTILLNLIMFKSNDYGFVFPFMNMFYAFVFAWYVVIGVYIEGKQEGGK